jgi:hypothetical protein
MPQVAFEPLPIFQGGRDWKLTTKLGEGKEGITVNYVDADNSWTLVQRRKKKKTKRDSQEEKWNAQQRENFLHFGDIYRGESYKNYRNVDVGPPVANIPLQQLNLPLSKLFHLPQRFLPQCNYRPSLQQLLHLQSLLLCLRQSQLHKAAKNAPGSRPFRKKTKKKKNRSRREQVIEALTPPPLHQPPTTPSLPKKALDPQAISESMPSGPKHPLKAGRIEEDLGGGTGPWRNRCPLLRPQTWRIWT